MPLKNIHSRWDALRETGSTMQWYQNLQQGSPITADVYVRTLGLYCERNHTTPEQILADAKSGALRNNLIKFITVLQGEDKQGSYIVRFKKTLNSWCLFNGVESTLRGVKVREANNANTVSSESPPKKEELAKILRLASTRGKAIIALLAFSGLRPESLGNYKGTDAIRLGDVDGLVITPDGIEIPKIPALLHVRESISKKGHRYFTFIPGEGVKYVLDYLNSRLKAGESLTKEAPLVGADKRYQTLKHNGIMRTVMVGKRARDAIRGAGLKFRPYALRVYFASALDAAEYDGGRVTHNWRAFWFGHKGDMSARYSTNKQLPPEMVEQMRESFQRCCKYIETVNYEEDESSTMTDFYMGQLEGAGFSREEIEKLNLPQLTPREIGRVMVEKMRSTSQEDPNVEKKGAKTEHKLVSEDELATYLEQGWEPILSTKEGKIAIRLSH
jgi:integrase